MDDTVTTDLRPASRRRMHSSEERRTLASADGATSIGGPEHRRATPRHDPAGRRRPGAGDLRRRRRRAGGAPVAGLWQCRRRAAEHLCSHRLARHVAWLARAQRNLSRERGGAARARRCRLSSRCRHRRARRRCDHGGLDLRHRDAEPRCGADQSIGPASRRQALAGLRPGLRRRRAGPVARRRSRARSSIRTRTCSSSRGRARSLCFRGNDKTKAKVQLVSKRRSSAMPARQRR